MDAARKIPPTVERELETKAPGYAQAVEAQVPSVLKADAPGYELWNLAYDWGVVNIFGEPHRDGWLHAVHYFSSISLPHMKAWAHWDRVNREWRTNPPAEMACIPSVANRSRRSHPVSNPEGVAQQVLDAVNSLPEGQWEHHLSRFFDLVGFSLWMELILDVDGARCPLLTDELANQYPDFAFSRPGLPSAEAVRELNSWVVQNTLRVDDESVLAALSWHVRNSPAYYALRNYAAECHECWSDQMMRQGRWRDASSLWISATTMPSGWAARSVRMIRRRGSAPSAANISAHLAMSLCSEVRSGFIGSIVP